MRLLDVLTGCRRVIGRSGLLTSAVVTLAAGMGFVGIATAQATVVHRAVVGTHYARIVADCPPPAPGHATCFALRRVAASAGTPGAKPYVVSSSYPVGPAGGYTPADLWSGYGLGSPATLTTPGGPGSNQTVGIVDAYNDPNINADLQTFDAQYPYLLPACSTSNGCLTVMGQTGGAVPTTNSENNWDTETSLDVETVHSVCPLCKIILVEANTTGLSDLGTAVNTAVTKGADEVTNSYGDGEGTTLTTSDTTIEGDFTHPGTVITVSAGDDGYYNWTNTSLGQQANTPASFQQVVAVGGTSLELSADGSRSSETVWSDGTDGGDSGGGCSTLYAAQSWQAAEAGYQSANCGGDRLVSDVSADADPITGFDIYDSYSGPGWGTYGGTSLSSPIIASIYALAGGAHGVLYPAQTLYTNESWFYDVTSGNNGCTGASTGGCGSSPPAGEDCGGTTACNAVTGYDGPSGIGAPLGAAPFAPPTGDPTSTTVSCSPTTVSADTATTCTATVTDTAATPSTPTGSVYFTASAGGSFSGTGQTCTLVATATTGMASCSLSFAPSSASASYTVSGDYIGDGTHAISHGTSSALTATPPVVDPTTTAMSCSPTTVMVNTETTCTATVTDTATTPSTPTGSVTFTATPTSAGEFYGTADPCTLTATATTGVASCGLSFKPTSASSSYTVSGAYGGDATHATGSGTSGTLTATTTAPPPPVDSTSTTLYCTPASVTVGSATRCEATVTDTAATPSNLTGSVTFAESVAGSFSATGNSCTLSATPTTGVAACGLSFTPSAASASSSVTAAYGGDGTHAASNGASPTLVVTAPSPTGSSPIAPTPIAPTPIEPTLGGAGVGVATVGRVTVSGTTVKVLLRCSATGPCDVALALSVAEKLSHGKVVSVAPSGDSHDKTVIIASATVTLSAGAARTVTLSLNGAGKRLWTERKLKKAKLVTSQKSTGATATVTFKPPSKPKGK